MAVHGRDDGDAALRARRIVFEDADLSVSQFGPLSRPVALFWVAFWLLSSLRRSVYLSPGR
jgi:hypothetical protein